MTLRPAVETFLAHVERGETERAARGVIALFDSGLSCAEIVADVLAPVQLEVGARWATAQWGVADEHLATAAVDEVVGALAARLEPGGQQTIALCSAEGEWHVTPLRMGALVLRERGWRVRLLGASTPPAHLRATLRHLRPDVATVHCAVPANLPGVPDVVAVAHEAGTPVLAAGRGFGSDDHRAGRLGCDGWAPDVGAGAGLAETWLDAPPPRNDVVPAGAEELALLRARQDDLAATAFGILEEQLPVMAAYDEQQREHTRRDLMHILDAAGATLLVDDPRLLAEFLSWLQLVLVARGVPTSALDAGLDALCAAATPGLPWLRELLAERDTLG